MEIVLISFYIEHMHVLRLSWSQDVLRGHDMMASPVLAGASPAPEPVLTFCIHSPFHMLFAFCHTSRAQSLSSGGTLQIFSPQWCVALLLPQAVVVVFYELLHFTGDGNRGRNQGNYLGFVDISPSPPYMDSSRSMAPCAVDWMCVPHPPT